MINAYEQWTYYDAELTINSLCSNVINCRKSSGFSRGVSKYRGVAKHHQNGRWEARIGRVFGNKYLYLGTYGERTPLPAGK